MPHFFFHVHEGSQRTADRAGISLPDQEAAWYQAYRTARDILPADPIERRIWAERSLEVEDEAGQAVWTLPFGDVLELVA